MIRVKAISCDLKGYVITMKKRLTRGVLLGYGRVYNNLYTKLFNFFNIVYFLIEEPATFYIPPAVHTSAVHLRMIWFANFVELYVFFRKKIQIQNFMVSLELLLQSFIRY